jgi:hypothetical protein
MSEPITFGGDTDFSVVPELKGIKKASIIPA